MMMMMMMMMMIIDDDHDGNNNHKNDNCKLGVTSMRQLNSEMLYTKNGWFNNKLLVVKNLTLNTGNMAKINNYYPRVT